MAVLSLKQQTIENFAANATQQAMMVHRRVNQKKNGAIESVPLLKKMKEKITEPTALFSPQTTASSAVPALLLWEPSMPPKPSSRC